MRYHHLGIPTNDPREGEYFLEGFGVHVTSHDDNPFGIQWMRYESDSPLPEIVRTLPHVAFQVDDLDSALEGRELLISPNSPSEGVKVAFILHDGAPVEFLEFEPGHPDRLPDGDEKKRPRHG
jgi:catechol 2,3-dioxygenase-like lactoylglutathione lyase family enzyme